MSKPKRYHLEMQKGDDGDWVLYEDYARLKAEVERWKLRSDNWQKFCQLTRPEMTDELNRLKAEVERLKEGNECLDQMHEKEMARSAFLCEQVERLTKAGEAMAYYIKGYSLADKQPYPRQVFHWNAAKEGKQP